ncbi:MAG TPA: hypothetical protein VLQ79_13875 [Myxococcaceae bacterium]|nr:hypothetical protein [Myxococcaceae bacterium]
MDLALLALGWMLLWTFEPHHVEADGAVRFRALQQLLEQGRWSPVEFPLIGTLLSAPLYLLGRVVQSPEWWVARFNVVLAGLGLVSLGVLLRGRVQGPVLRGALLLLLAGSMLTHQLSAFGAETFNVLALGVGLAAWTGGRQVLGGAALALGMANVPATSLAVALALGDWGVRNRRLRAALPLDGFVLLWLAENWLRRGHPLQTGYEGNAGYRTALPYSGRPGFSYPLALGVLQLLLSFGKGLLFFAPGLFLLFPAARRALRPAAPFQRACLWVVAGLLLVYGQWWAWYGGYSWGPRFLVFAAIPASLRLAAECAHPPRRLLPLLAVLGALLLSLWGGFDGAVLRFWKQELCTASNYAVEAFCWDVPEFSVLFTPFVWAPRLEPGGWLLLGYGLLLAVRLGAAPAVALAGAATAGLSRGARAWRQGPRVRF